MIPSNIVKEKTGLTLRQLDYLSRLRLIPHPTRIPALGRPGAAYAYPDTVLDRIRRIQTLQAHGLSLARIARELATRPMIPTKIVRDKTGLSQRRLDYMHHLGLIPPAARMPTPGRPGSARAYPATIFTRLHVIEFLQGHGFTLTQIAQSARGTPFECPPSGPCEAMPL